MDDDQYRIRDTDLLVYETLRDMLPMHKQCTPLSSLYGPDVMQITLGYVPVVRAAAEMLRKGWSRYDSVEMAFDFLLWQGAKEWDRIGEVVLLRTEGIAAATCTRKEES